jgi:hypothetical protein
MLSRACATKSFARRILVRGSGADGIRTHDLLRARQALSQLSYRPGNSKSENLFYLEGKLNRRPVT